MIVTASTVLEDFASITRFVTGNLANGVDHMVLFLDAPHPDEVLAWCEEQPAVTVVHAYGDWWRGDRPENLNIRQMVNVNALRAFLVPVDDVAWLFHIDADEFLRLDLDALAAVPDSAIGVRATPHEVVAGHTDWFKRLVGGPEDESGFRGHTVGKSGIRPRLDIGVNLHVPMVGGQPHLTPPLVVSVEGVDVYHLDAPGFDQWRRRRMAMATSGKEPPLYLPGEHRHAEFRAVKEAIDSGATGEELERRLRDVYAAGNAEDLDALRARGLVDRVDVLAGDHVPHPDTAELGAWVRRCAAAFLAMPLLSFWVQQPEQTQELGLRTLLKLIDLTPAG